MTVGVKTQYPQGVGGGAVSTETNISTAGTYQKLPNNSQSSHTALLIPHDDVRKRHFLRIADSVSPVGVINIKSPCALSAEKPTSQASFLFTYPGK